MLRYCFAVTPTISAAISEKRLAIVLSMLREMIWFSGSFTMMSETAALWPVSSAIALFVKMFHSTRSGY